MPVKVGGPATNQREEDFEPGMYLKKGYVLISRGCNNHCWFCFVWRRNGKLRELPIKDGWIVQDDNLLSCSDQHIKSVFEMLKRQPENPKFTGGLEAKLLKPWHVDLLRKAKSTEIFFANDTPDDYEPLIEAGKLLNSVGFTLRSRKCFCYVLIGYPGDTFDKAEKRLTDTLKAGFIPFAMLYRNAHGDLLEEWKPFQRIWARPAIIVSRNPQFFAKG